MSLKQQPARLTRSTQLSVLRLLHAAQQLLLVQPVATFLPLISQLLQQHPNLFARGNAHSPDVMATNGKGRHSPVLHLLQQVMLTLVLEQLTHTGDHVRFPALGITAHVSLLTSSLPPSLNVQYTQCLECETPTYCSVVLSSNIE